MIESCSVTYRLFSSVMDAIKEKVEITIATIVIAAIVQTMTKFIFFSKFQLLFHFSLNDTIIIVPLSSRLLLSGLSIIYTLTFVHSIQRRYPFTAPAVMPFTSLSCAKINKIIIGRTVSVSTAIIMGVFIEYCP